MAATTTYLSSVDGSDASDGLTWANAEATEVAALVTADAGGTVYMDNAHAETQAGAMTLASAGTAAAPTNVICASRASGEPPTTVAATGSVSTTGANAMGFTGFAYHRGVIYQVGSGAVAANMAFTSTAPSWWKFEACELSLVATGASLIVVGPTSTNDNNLVELVNSNIRFAGTGQSIATRSTFRWRGGSLLGTAPLVLFTPTVNSAGGSHRIEGVDLSGVAAKLVLTSQDVYGKFLFLNCKFHASTTIASGEPAGHGGLEVEAINCGSAATGNNNYYLRRFPGEVLKESTIVRSGGATDGVTPFSMKMTTGANAKFATPMYSPWVWFWSDSLAAQTVSVPVVSDNVTFTDGEAWVEVDYQGAAASPLTSSASDAKANILATAVAQPLDTASTWTTTGLVTPIKQTLSTSVTPLLKGWYRARVALAKASATMYFCPKLSGSSTRQYFSEAGAVNDPLVNRHISY